MDRMVGVGFLIGCVSLLYATAGQAGGTAFLAVMASANVPADELRATALTLNIVAAGYATWRLYQQAAFDTGMFAKLTVPSLLAAFLGGSIVLRAQFYFVLTGVLLIAAGILMVFKHASDHIDLRPIRVGPASLVGAGAGFISGLTGVGGGVFLTPALVALGWATPRRAAQLSPPFILCNSVLGLAGVLLAGQKLAAGSIVFAACALGGAAVGSIIGLRWMSQRATRYVLAGILLFAGVRLLFR